MLKFRWSTDCVVIKCILIIISATLYFTSIPSWAQTQSKDRLAVLLLRNRISMSREEVEYLTGLVRQIASKRLGNEYLIMTQENVEVLLPPNTDLESCVSECQVETGRMIGARFIITGEVLRFGKSLRLTLRMHDTKTGHLVSSEVAKSKDIEGLESSTENAVSLLIHQIQNHRQNPAPPKLTTTRPTQDPEPVIIVEANGGLSRHKSSLRSSILTEQQRVKQRAQQAHIEREERLHNKYQQRQMEREQRQKELRQREQRQKELRQKELRQKELRQKAQQNQTSSLWRPVQNELYLGLGRGKCELDGEECSGLEHDVSLQLGLTYHFNDRMSTQRWHWHSGLDIKYAHSSFSSSFDGPMEMYTVNTLTVAYLFSYITQRLNLQFGIGWGLSYGHISSEQYNESDYSLIDFEFNTSNTLTYGLSLGFRLTPTWRLIIYSDIFEVLGEVEMCDFYSETCSTAAVPRLVQTGLKMSWTH